MLLAAAGYDVTRARTRDDRLQGIKKDPLDLADIIVVNAGMRRSRACCERLLHTAYTRLLNGMVTPGLFAGGQGKLNIL